MLLLLAIVFFLSYENLKASAEPGPWKNARWIALEELPESMTLVPGVHGNGDQLGNRGLKRSMVPMFRKEFWINDSIEQATVHICGLGHYELYINHEKTGDRFLSPGWTDYQKKCLYNSYDITEQLQAGGNAIGVLVGNGFYNINRERYRKLVIAYGYPKVIFHIRIQLKNGTVQHVVSDENCRVKPSPITFSSIYGGEDYNANLEEEGWGDFGFDDSHWQIPVLLDDTRETLVPEADYPLKVMQTFHPRRIFQSKTGRTIYDFGQNASAIVSLKVQGNQGAQIKIRPGELLDENLDISQRSSGEPYELNYTLKGKGIETWQPRFTYYGFRYADVEIVEPKGQQAGTDLVELLMLHTRNAAPTLGAFTCSDTLFNAIFELINWAMKSNMASVTTDCPHREKLGWLEQTHLIGPSLHYNYDIRTLYLKIMGDLMDSQLENGLVPDIAPEYVPFEGGFRDSPEWGSASVLIPWQLYTWYGDKKVLEQAYPMMRRYVNYLQSQAKGHLLHHGLGDWYDLGPNHPGEAQLTPKSLTASSIYYYDLVILAKVATLLNMPSDALRFRDRAREVKAAFQEQFYDPETGVCATGSQTSYAMALYTGILPEEDHQTIFQNLLDSIEQQDYRLSSGDIGYHYLVRVLSENGRSDVLYKMNSRSDRPGYGYQLKRGATALTESWAALPDVSNNHMMLGHLMEWFYSGLGGISQQENSIAYRSVIIAPKPVGDMTWVKCSYKSPQGLIVSEWERRGNTFSLIVEVPETSSAKIIIPDDYQNSTLETVSLTDFKPVQLEVHQDAFELAPGRYKITARRGI